MKLTHVKLIETLRALNNGSSKYQARKIAGISKQRVYQVWRQYQNTGVPPVIGRLVGRPCKLVTPEERLIVSNAYARYGICAEGLEPLILRDSGRHIGHNRIHKILVEMGYAKKGVQNMPRKKTWIRYERRHSLTAVHIDWHQRPHDGIWIFAVIDDASRKILVVLEGVRPTVEESIHGMELALTFGKISQVISDHGCQFTTNNGGESRFRNWLDAHGIKHILCRVKHPQSNGKIEKWFHLYETHRDHFVSIEKLLIWYNDVRPHRSLNWENLETPNQAFERKKRAEV